ncbi:hypothetical protein [Roseibium sp. RKSG952]|nr:hypothetical protein [Roseibium sp. RKSG952]
MSSGSGHKVPVDRQGVYGTCGVPDNLGVSTGIIPAKCGSAHGSHD